MIKMRLWEKDFGTKKMERIYVNTPEIDSGDKLFIERIESDYCDWKIFLKTDYIQKYYQSYSGRTGSEIGIEILEKHIKIPIKFDDFKVICK